MLSTGPCRTTPSHPAPAPVGLPLVLAALVAACGPPAPEIAEPAPVSRPDLVLITLDTVRADRVGAYGDPHARTPNLDRLAAQSALFREATTPVPLTLPAHASLLTGLYPHRHGLRDNGGFRLASTVPVVTTTLAESGYHTGAFVGAYVLDAAWGLDRGFAVYDAPFHPEDVARSSSFGDVERPAREVVRQALTWWDEAGSPRFLWVHLYDAHHPYQPPPEWTGDPYRGEIFAVDRALRPLLSAIGEDALVVAVGDHGEGLWDGGELEHGLLLTRSVLRVPLLVRPPGGPAPGDPVASRPGPARPPEWAPVPGLHPDGLLLEPVPDAPRAGRVIEEPVSLVDVAPTLLDYAGLAHDDIDGRSLRPLVEGEAREPAVVYSETVYPYLHLGWSPSFSARDRSRWVLRTPSTRVVDPDADPLGLRPLSEPPPPLLLATLDALSTGWDRPPGPMDPQTMRLLEALGYLSTPVAPPRDDLPDAAARIDLLHRLALAQGRMASDPAGAEEDLVALLATDSDLVDAWFSLGNLRLAAEDAEGALAAYAEVLARAPSHTLALSNTVVVLRGQGRLDEALEATASLQALHPHDPRWFRLQANLLGMREDPRGVLGACDRGLAVAPTDPYLLYMRGLAQVQLDDPAAALSSLEEARARGSRARDISMWVGEAHRALGQVDQAVAAYHQAARDNPADVRPVVAAGMVLVQEGRCEDALPYLFTALERGVGDPTVREAYRACGTETGTPLTPP